MIWIELIFEIFYYLVVYKIFKNVDVNDLKWLMIGVILFINICIYIDNYIYKFICYGI